MHSDGAFQNSLNNYFRTVTSLTGSGVVYHDMHSPKTCHNEKLCSFCRTGLELPETGSYCRHTIRGAAMASFASGEPYFYQCWAGLLFAAVAVAPRRECRGAVAIGGFFAGEQHAFFHEGLSHHLTALSMESRNSLLRTADSLRPISAGALRGLGRLLLEASYSHGLNSSDFMLEQNRRYQQQREIAEVLHEARKDASGKTALNISLAGTPADIYPLLNYLQQNDREQARRFVSEYLARLLTATNWNLYRLKAHLRLLPAVLSSEAILQGESWHAATSLEWQQMIRLERADTTEAACAVIADIVLERFSNRRPKFTDPPSLSARVLSWLRRNYMEKTTLTTAGRVVGASPSSIIQHLRRDTRKSFHRHLMEIRVAEAKKLLACTNMEISQIAEFCGFSDQSHFTRYFKQQINLTPGKFRRLLRLPLSP